MTLANYNLMDINELRHYVLTNRKDLNAFYTYIDRSKASGQMITIDPSSPDWEKDLDQKIHQAELNTPDLN